MLDRRQFLLCGGAGLLATAALRPSRARAAVAGFQPLNVRRYAVEVGAIRPFSVLHVSDTHFAFCDGRDNERKIKLAASRFGEMARAEHYLDEALRLAEREQMMFVHTGDLIDFTSQANFDMVRGHLVGIDSLVCAGNHEFSQYVGEAKEDAVYKAASYAEVQKHYPNDLTFFSREVHGVNFVAVDNVYYDFTEAQLALMEKEIAKGLPIVILCHVPLYSEALHARLLAAQSGKCAYMCGTPDALLGSDPVRVEQQRANAATKAFVERLRKEPLVKAILCGHVHCPETDRFSPTAMTYVAGANYLGDVSRIDFA